MRTLNRLLAIGSFLCLSVATLSAVAAEERQAAKRPNVLLICVDDLKPALGCYGDATAQSPNLDRLAKRATLFEGAYCNQAVCSPSRNALLVGLRPQTLGIYDLATNFRRSRPDAVTLPQAFKKQGWRTEALGKIFHVGHGNRDDAASWSVPHWKSDVVAYALPESRPDQKKTREEALFSNESAAGLQRGAAYESADVPDDGYPDGAVATEAIARLRAAKERPEEPFFLAVGFVKPHLPFCAPKKYWDLYDRDAFQLASVDAPPEGAPKYAPTASGELRNYQDMPDKGPIDPETQRTLIHGYYAAMSYTDAQIGRVVDELERLGLAGDTVVVVWGDHGWHLGDHGMWCKHSNYEQATRIPLMVALPGSLGGRTKSLAETVDIYPTLCELAGIAPPEGLDGKSFAPTLRDAKAPTKEHVLHVYPRNPEGVGPVIGRAVRTDRYRLVEWKKIGAPAESADIELYDYQDDPLERKNLAADRPEIVAQLRERLASQPEAKPQIAAAAPVSKPTLVESYKIWDQAPHNAFTDLVHFKGRWLCVFREGAAHVSPDGALRVIESKDGRTWKPAALIQSKTADLRDAKISVMPDGRLMLSGAGALHDQSQAKHQSLAWFSTDGRTWSDAHKVGDPNFWLWRTTWHDGTAYGVGYGTGDDKSTRLYASEDGKSYRTLVERLHDVDYPNESSIVFDGDRAYCLLRRDEGSATGLLGTSTPPYESWEWKALGAKIGGPHAIRLPDGRYVAAVRLYDGKVRTALCWLDVEKGKLEEFLALPSGGDTSYAGLVFREKRLWVSYYSSHEGKTSIYLAKVALPPKAE